MSDAQIPIGRFNPVPGITVDYTGTSVSIFGQMELSGPEATRARAASIQESINRNWTRRFLDGYEVTWAIVVRYRPPGAAAGAVAQIEADKIAGPSHFNRLNDVMTLNANENGAFGCTPAHEFGHVIGMKDRYTESIVSSLKGMVGGERTNELQPGYERNMMGVDQGVLESTNVANIIAENEPSAYWTNDDDYVVAWVQAHSLADIGRLPAAEKLRAIWVLQGGWISADDPEAMGKICKSVITHAEGDDLRHGVNTQLFNDLGQRARMRVYLAKMP